MGGYLGRVALTAKGTMTVSADGSWSFNGTVSGDKDVYDANADASRGKVGELLTDVLRVIDGKVFDINFQGEHEVSVSGKK
ncbi:lipid II-degrading bacteriocin [Serratia ficaria]|uniref:lipid II-degrading bacteriocin n=1 Tax=Serratia ficaria TaxID=61651 RepID=UPI0021C85C5C|nr:lipid II-degrading bacteriocin [Serratia ficaria]